MVTGLLIGLILPFTTVWFLIIAVSILTIVFKQLLKYRGRVIFNPAALGLLISSLILKTQISWWAVAWSSWFILFLIITQGYVLRRIKRLWLPLSFLFSYAVYLFLKSSGNILPLLFDSTIFFFALIMLSEPQSSPSLKYWQYFFGPLAVINIFLLSSFSQLDLDPLLTSLVLANGESFLIRKIKHEI